MPHPHVHLPFNALTPKDDTQAGEFLRRHPSYDGRGIIVAVLDTGIDPGAAGLSICPDGSPKIVDVVEASGSGDVAMRTTIKPCADGTITGLTGRTLRLNPKWTNPTGEFRIGIKRAFELFPKPLVDRTKRERAEATGKEVAALLAAAMEEQAAFAAFHPSPLPGSPEAATAEELAKRVSLLKDSQVLPSEDLGPVYDVVSWHDGAVWRAVIDSACNGDLSAETGFTDYRRELQWGVLDSSTLLSYAFNFYDDGDVLSIVTDAGG